MLTMNVPLVISSKEKANGLNRSKRPMLRRRSGLNMKWQRQWQSTPSAGIPEGAAVSDEESRETFDNKVFDSSRTHGS